MAAPQTPSVINFVQAQPFILAGSGASIGDTTVTLQSMVGIDGTTIVTADLGSFAYGTLEPGNGDQEEAILFTGVTQNANGTATLTGVCSLGFKQPYTVTTGLTKTHAGASKFIMSNDAAFYNNLVLYMNDIAGAGAANASTTVKGIVQAATTAQINSATPTGSTGAVLAVTPDALVNSTNNQYVSSIIDTGVPYAVATGTPTAYTATLATGFSTLASGATLNFLANTSNATGVTLNVKGLGAKSITKRGSTALASGDILSGQIAEVIYDGTRFQLINDTPQTFTTGLTSKDIAVATAAQLIPHGLGRVPSLIKMTGVTSSSADSQQSAAYSYGTFNGITNRCVYNFIASSTSGTTNSAQSTSGTDASNILLMYQNTSAQDYAVASASVDATNITLAWTKTNSPTGSADIQWEAYA